MDICHRIDIEVATTFRVGLPGDWSDDPVLAAYSAPHELIRAVRGSTYEADSEGLALLARGEPESRLLLMAAAIPLALRLCRDDSRDLIDDVMAELAVVIDAAADRPINRRGRPLVIALVDLAFDRVRKREQRARNPFPVAVEDPVWRLRRAAFWAEEEAMARLEVFEIRQRMARNPRIASKAERHWETAIELVDAGSISEADRNRLAHARRQLRQWVDPRLVA